jgi:uncharacterized protein (TIGR03067 family)
MDRILRSTVAVAFLAAFAACGPNEEPRKATASQQEATEIVFRGRFCMEKACREGPKGELALGLHPVCEVLEVLAGQLKLKRLIDIDLPKDVKVEEAYRFRWRPSESTLEEVRKAEAGGYTGMWLGGERLELIAPEQQGRNDDKELLGSWKVISAEHDGKPFTDGMDTTLVITAEKVIFKPTGQDKRRAIEEATYKLDPSKSPKEIDLLFVEDKPKRTVAVRGIYLVEGNNIKLCMEAIDGKEQGKGRPKDFVTKDKSGHLLLILEGQKE